MQSSDNQTFQQILSDYQKTISRLVLFGINEMPIPQGVRRTIDFLKGTRSSYVINHELNKLDSFSTLVGYTRDQLSDVLDVLIKNQLVKIEYYDQNEDQYPVLKITPTGLNFLKNPSNLQFEIIDILMDKDVPDIDEDDQDLYYKLKLARRQLAEEFDIPAFMVCNDEVLRAICISKPMEAEELIKITGIDVKFMELYSKQFLYVIRQYITREKGS